MISLPVMILLSLNLALGPGDQIDDGEGDVMSLTLIEAIEKALENNLTLQGGRLDAEQVLAGYGEAWGALDTVWFADVTAREDVSPAAPSDFFGGVGGGKSTDLRYTFRTGLRGAMLSGSTWEFGVGPTHRYSDSATNPHIDTYSGDWSFSLTQPLGRDGGDYTREGLEVAALDTEIAVMTEIESALAAVEEVITAYWNLVFAIQSAQTKEVSVELATDLVAITQRTYEQGLRNRIDVVEAEAELAQRREEQISAANEQLKAEDALRTVMLAPSEGKAWSVQIVPTTDPLSEEAVALPALDELITRGLVRRPDVIKAQMDLDKAATSVSRAKNQAESQFDLTAAYGINSSERNFVDTLTELNASENHSVSLVLSWEKPLGNRAAGYALRAARLARDRAGVNLAEAKMEAIEDIRTEERNVRLRSQGVLAAAESARLNKEVYEGEKRRLENDLSTPFKVRETLRNYLDAVDVETRARLDLELSRVALAGSQGVLLDAYGFESLDVTSELGVQPPPIP